MGDICWPRFPLISQFPHGKTWLTIQMNLGLAQNTLDAYGRALEDFFSFCSRLDLSPGEATKEHISTYVRDLATRPNPRGTTAGARATGTGLANATMQQRLTAVRLFFDYLVEEGSRPTNPVGRGRYTAGKGFGGQRDKGLIPRYHTLPWLPSNE